MRDAASLTRIWTGTLNLHLLNREHETAALLEFYLRADTISIDWRGTNLAVVSRDDLRHWLLYREEPLVVDDMIFTVEGSRIAISIFGQRSYLLPETFVFELAGVI